MMEIVIQALKSAWHLLATGDPQTYRIIGLSIFVSMTATLLATILGVPVGLLLSSKDFFGKTILIRLTYMTMSTPPVIMGLVVYLLFSRKGPLGNLGWLFTYKTMIIAQFLLVLPIIVGQMYGFSRDRSPQILLVGKTLGATPWQLFLLLCKELKPSIFMTFALGFGRATSEVGAVMLVGGNIKHKTRVMTTSITTFMGMGNYEMSFAFSIVLLCISFLIQSVVYRYQQDDKVKG